VLGRDRAVYAGRKTLVVGAGTSTLEAREGLNRIKACLPASLRKMFDIGGVQGETIEAQITEVRGTISTLEAQLREYTGPAYFGDPEARQMVSEIRFVLDAIKSKVAAYESYTNAANSAVEALMDDVGDRAADEQYDAERHERDE
jgi:hypothetical protein